MRALTALGAAAIRACAPGLLTAADAEKIKALAALHATSTIDGLDAALEAARSGDYALDEELLVSHRARLRRLLEESLAPLLRSATGGSSTVAEEEAEAMVVEEAEAERLRAALYKAEDLADLAKLPSSILQKASSRLASLAAAAQPTAPARLARHASKANAKIKWRKDTPAKYTDWTIKLMGHEYTVHRIILDYWDYWNRVFSQPGASGETDLRLSLGANSGQADFTVQRTTPAAFEWLLDFWYDPDGCTDVSAVGGEELIVLWALAGEFQVLEQVRPLPRLSLFRLSPLSP